MRRALAVIGLLAACDPEPITPPPHPCESDVTSIDVAPPRQDFGLTDGSELWCGTPPQGGAPYTPMRVRLEGPASIADGVWLELIATDAGTGEALATTELTTRLTCANVGDSAGHWVGSEVHMRYIGFDLADLEGREAELTVRATTLDDDVVIEDAWLVDLVLE